MLPFSGEVENSSFGSVTVQLDLWIEGVNSRVLLSGSMPRPVVKDTEQGSMGWDGWVCQPSLFPEECPLSHAAGVLADAQPFE